jgi:serine/threonine protein kinase
MVARLSRARNLTNRLTGTKPGGTGSTLDPECYLPRTLKHELQQRGRLPVEECLRIALSLTTALEHLHGHGLIHRDIKPSNIVFVEGVPKLADIGLVATLDATMSVSGTPGYIAPEGSGTPRGDIYSLARKAGTTVSRARPRRGSGKARQLVPPPAGRRPDLEWYWL